MSIRLKIVLLASCACAAVWADGAPTHIKWNGWEVSSSEDFSKGTTHNGYPLMNLFDGDPRTAWVFSAKGSWPDPKLPKHWIE